MSTPHARGSTIHTIPLPNERVSTPHARGSTLSIYLRPLTNWVYPACAGIHPLSIWLIKWLHCLPRMRGDPPLSLRSDSYSALSTPHARGSTLIRASRLDQQRVYPACAGIHLDEEQRRFEARRLPRMRGDPPTTGKRW